MFILVQGKVAVNDDHSERILASGQAIGCTDIQYLRSGISIHADDSHELDPFIRDTYTVQAEAEFMCIDGAEFRNNYDQYVQLLEEGQTNISYVASFLASLDVFRNWPWCEVVDLATEVQGVQVDKGIALFRYNRMAHDNTVIVFRFCFFLCDGAAGGSGRMRRCPC